MRPTEITYQSLLSSSLVLYLINMLKFQVARSICPAMVASIYLIPDFLGEQLTLSILSSSSLHLSSSQGFKIRSTMLVTVGTDVVYWVIFPSFLCVFVCVWCMPVCSLMCIWRSEVSVWCPFFTLLFIPFLWDIFLFTFQMLCPFLVSPPKIPYLLPPPSALQRTHSHFLALTLPHTRAYSLHRTESLFSHWWPTRPSSATYPPGATSPTICFLWLVV